MTTKKPVHIHQKHKTKSDNTGIVALGKDGKLTGITTEKANTINIQVQKAFSEETTSEPIPIKGKSKNDKHHSIQTNQLTQIKSVEKYRKSLVVTSPLQ
jgi:hypothetical protein